VRSALRSIAAVIAGVAAIGVTSFAADYIVTTMAPDAFATGTQHANTPILIFIAAYSIVLSALGGYVTAWLAPRAPAKHVIALAVLQLIGGIVAGVEAEGIFPQWFSFAVVILPVPAIILGGMIRSRTS
jgi:hypothetical protein